MNIEAMGTALGVLLSPTGAIFLMLGTCVGLTVGAIPGLSGIVGMTLLLPFILPLEPEVAILMFIGVTAVTHTGDTVPAVLFGVPGTAGAMATVVDGYPMAKKGEAARALSAAYTVSAMGGVIGAVFLLATVPIVRELVLLMKSPELLMMALMGLSMVGVLATRAPLMGLALAAFGLLVSQVGTHLATGTCRWWFGQAYLVDGVPTIPAILGIFGFTEMSDLAIRSTKISAKAEELGKGAWQGVRDGFHHWFLMLRCSAIGVWIGVIPGVGAAVADWMAYGHAVQTEKPRESFGTGDVRGVIASESANNSKAGGSLLPTLAFGVPGSGSMIVLLAAFTMLGVVPGPKLFTETPQLIYVIIWGLAVANIIGCLLCFALTKPMAKICQMPIAILAPLVMVFLFIGVQQTTNTMWDLYTLVFFGILGYILKKVDWPRIPIVLGLVLGGIIERYLFISNASYGISWLWRPGVIIIFLLTIAGVIYASRGMGQVSKGERR
ncbi:tripartite tricarboxylate transporter permease [Chloroflexota bacterium]